MCKREKGTTKKDILKIIKIYSEKHNKERGRGEFNTQRAYFNQDNNNLHN